jgi:hypothetical protein
MTPFDFILHNSSLILPAAVRPPWPDELPRLADAFPKYPRHHATRPLLLLTSAGGVERIGGVAGVSDPVNGMAALTLHLRPRFLAEPDAGLATLLDAVAGLARSLGAHTLHTTDSLTPADPRVTALRRHGFAHARTDEVWRTEFTEMLPRLDRVHQRLETVGRLAGHTVTPLAEADLPEVRALMLAAGLLRPERVFLLPADDQAASRGHHAALSPVVRRAGRLVGALLARYSGDGVTFEAQAVDPACIGGLDLANHLTVRGVAQAGLAAGRTHMVFSADTAKAPATIRMARRMGGRRLNEFVVLARAL